MKKLKCCKYDPSQKRALSHNLNFFLTWLCQGLAAQFKESFTYAIMHCDFPC